MVILVLLIGLVEYFRLFPMMAIPFILFLNPLIVAATTLT